MIAAVDCVSIPAEQLNGFLRVLGDRECVLHAASVDMQLFREHTGGQVPMQLFDTQVRLRVSLAHAFH